MKKLLIFFIFVLSIFFLSRTIVVAADKPTYGCAYTGGSCHAKAPLPDPASSGCETGYLEGVCRLYQNKTDCEKAAIECVSDSHLRARGLNITCGTGGTSINTAIGCIPIGDPNAFVGFILKWGIGLGAGIAFLLIIYAGFQIMTASGSPDRLKAGQELLTSAIAGLILIVFSVFILRVIGVDILKLPGFGK